VPPSDLLGDLLIVVSENLLIKIVIFDNGKLGFIDIEQKAAGLIPIYTGLKTPDFGKIAAAMGFWGRVVSKAGELDGAITEWLARQVRPCCKSRSIRCNW
jgi:pyruvate dehydrogenase (quinone)